MKLPLLELDDLNLILLEIFHFHPGLFGVLSYLLAVSFFPEKILNQNSKYKATSISSNESVCICVLYVYLLYVCTTVQYPNISRFKIDNSNKFGCIYRKMI